MLLFAGISSIFSFGYFILNDIVKKLKQWRESAGNKFYHIKDGTSETLRNKARINSENIKPISVHVATHLKPSNDEQFGHYLAGLIEGDGHFSSKQQLVIVFSSLDVSLAYFIKEKLGYGSVKKVKDKNAYVLVVAAEKGIEKVINLINGKIRTENKFNQITKNILSHVNYARLNINLTLNKNDDLKNHWLAGFSDADASFQIKVLDRNEKIEIRLNYQVDQKNSNVLLLIKNLFGGNIGYRKTQDTYYYGSTSLGSAKKVINYFDYFHLLSSKHINYLKWRKAYIIIQNKDHLNENGLKKIIKVKNTMNRLNVTTIA